MNFCDENNIQFLYYSVTSPLLKSFQGFVISDWQGIDRITSPPGSNYSYSVQAGVNAGIDMVSIFSTCNIVR